MVIVTNKTAGMRTIYTQKVQADGKHFRVDLAPGDNNIPDSSWDKIKDLRYTEMLSDVEDIEVKVPKKSKSKKGKSKNIEGL